MNYPFVFLAYGVGGVLGPILGGIMGDAKLWMWAFIPAGVACILAAMISATLKPITVTEPAVKAEIEGELDGQFKKH